jgi:outer membrane protein OmpA-like peptidoglycan-associated protein
MAVDWLADVQKYDAGADPDIVTGIVRYCGIALQKRDSSLVSFSSPDELKRVRDNFLKKKLGRTEDDAVLDDAISSVGQAMKADRTKNRVTVYYLLARHFGQLDLFDRSRSSSGKSGAATAGKADDGPSPISTAEPAVDPERPTGAGSRSSSPGTVLAGAGAAASLRLIGEEDDRANSSAGVPGPADARGGGSIIGVPPQAPRFGGDRLTDAPEGGGSRWWLWLILGAIALLLLFLVLRSCGHQPKLPSESQFDTSTASQAAGNLAATAGTVLDGTAPTSGAPTAGSETAVPANGAGIITETLNGLPALKVYFDVGKSAVTGDAVNASKALRNYLQAHPTAHVGVSGYNDPTGNPALNAALSKSRAQNVAAALEKAGVPASAIVLEKPANSTSASTGAESRRVEVVVRP